MVFYMFDEDQIAKSRLGIESDPAECGLMEYTFYEIAHVHAYSENSCVVASDGEDFIINESVMIVKRKIKQANLCCN